MTERRVAERRKCNIQEDGLCHIHDVEVEKREQLEKLALNIPKLLTAVNRLIGWSVLMTILVIGSYAYTQQVKNDAKTESDQFGKKASIVNDSVIRLEEKQSAILREIANMNGLMLSFHKQQEKQR